MNAEKFWKMQGWIRMIMMNFDEGQGTNESTCLEVYVTNLIKLLLCAFNIFIYIMWEISINADGWLGCRVIFLFRWIKEQYFSNTLQRQNPRSEIQGLKFRHNTRN